MKSYMQTVLFLTRGQVLISREGQRDLEHLLFLIYFVVLAPISYLELTLTDKSKGVWSGQFPESFTSIRLNTKYNYGQEKNENSERGFGYFISITKAQIISFAFIK